MKNYGAISFTGIPVEGSFDEQILAGRKTQTIRRPRKDGRAHVKVGYTTKLYWKMRVPKESRLIGYAEIIAYEETTLLDMWFDEENAKADGFRDLKEFREWFWDYRATGQPSWEGLLRVIKQSVEAAAQLDKNVTKEIIIGVKVHRVGGRRVGKSSTMKIVEYLMQPVYRIKWRYPLCQQTAVNA